MQFICQRKYSEVGNQTHCIGLIPFTKNMQKIHIGNFCVQELPICIIINILFIITYTLLLCFANCAHLFPMHLLLNLFVLYKT